MLRAGFTEVLVTGMLMRWISVSANPMKIGANPALARVGSVAPMITIRNPAVSTVSQSAAAGSA